MQLARSKVVTYQDVTEEILDNLIDEMGKLPTNQFDVQVVVTVIVTPLPDEPNYTVTESMN